MLYVLTEKYKAMMNMYAMAVAANRRNLACSSNRYNVRSFGPRISWSCIDLDIAIMRPRTPLIFIDLVQFPAAIGDVL